MSLRLGEIIQALGGELRGAGAAGAADDLGNIEITSLAPLDRAEEGSLSFLAHPKRQADLARSKASCVVVAPSLVEAALERGVCIVTPDPYLYFAKLTQLWKQSTPGHAEPGIHPSAFIDAQASIHPSARIGPHCVVERGARIGAGTELKARVTVSERCTIGERCLVHPGAVIGADGFGFAPNGGRWEKIEQLGAVVIGDDVEIGANTCIDRGALQDTVLEDGVKLDNLIQIGHNVLVGRHTAMAACVGIAGSASIGAHCTLGGGAIVLGHLKLADHVHISAASVVTRSILKPGHYTGFFPLDTNEHWEKNAAVVKRLHQMRARQRSQDISP